MKILLKNRKGMTFLEVLIALAVLGLLSVPIMMMFMNAQIYARKVDKQTKVNAITRTVKQLVSENLDGDGFLYGIGEGDVGVDIDEDGVANDTFKRIITYADEISDEVITPPLRIEGSGINEDYFYTLKYVPDKYYDENYKGVYNILITIKEKESSEVLNRLKVSVNLDSELTEEESEEGD